MSNLYVMQRSDAPQFVKVGRSDHPVQRAESLQSGHCFFMRVLAIFSDVGQHERWVHDQLKEFQVQTGAGQEWFHTDLSTVYSVIGRIGAGHPICMPNLGNNAGDYASLTASVDDALTAAEMRQVIATASGLSKKQVHDRLQMHGFSEVTSKYKNANNKRTTKRVYRKGQQYAALSNRQNQ